MTKPNNEKMSLGARKLKGVNGIADIGSNSGQFSYPLPNMVLPLDTSGE
jgi:hypothetical protein